MYCRALVRNWFTDIGISMTGRGWPGKRHFLCCSRLVQRRLQTREEGQICQCRESEGGAPIKLWGKRAIMNWGVLTCGALLSISDVLLRHLVIPG